jgi:carbon-monoxide dehydrogenase large subunit
MNDETAPRRPYRFIGKPLPRKEDERLVIGKGRFTDDFNLDGQVHAAMVRSPHPHARIVAIDVAAAKAMPRVLGIFTGADCASDGLAPIPHDPVPKTKYDMKLTGPGGGSVFAGPHVLLPADRVRHVGEAVAMVVAATRAQALDAAEAVVVRYQELPFVLHSEDALAALWDEAANNICVDTSFGDAAATDQAFARAAHVVRRKFHIGRVTGVPLEPRAALGAYDAATGRYTLYAGSGGAVRQKRELATVLGIAPESLRVLSYDVGGNFGTRNRVFVEFGLVLWAAKKLGRSVKFTATRAEAFLSDYQGRDLVSEVELALDQDGRMLAMRATNISNVGARCVSLSPLSKGAGLIPGSYAIPAAHLRALAVFTNTMPTQAYRSSGRPEVTYAIERLVDIAADELGNVLGLDRVALRRKNLIRPQAMPYRNAVGMVYDSGCYQENMAWAMDVADWKGFAARRREARRRGKLLGLGLANYVESSIGAPREQARIKVQPEGRVDVIIGTQPSGQGHETTFAQVVSDLLFVPSKAVHIILGDTDVVQVGGGSHSGRSMRHAATVFSKAAVALIGKGKEIAALVMGIAPEHVSFADGRFAARDTNRTFDFLELAQALATSPAAQLALPEKLKDGLAVVTDNEMHDPVFPNGTAICEVEIDPDTGEMKITRYASVDDVGRCINPLIVHGQTHGAIAQGVGQAMSEQIYLDPDSGQPLTGSLMDYAMPRADTLPAFAVEIAEVLSPTNPLGIKAGGEGGTTAAPAAVVSGILDALRPLGVREIAMPATPYAIWSAIAKAKAAQAAE